MPVVISYDSPVVEGGAEYTAAEGVGERSVEVVGR